MSWEKIIVHYFFSAVLLSVLNLLAFILSRTTSHQLGCIILYSVCGIRNTKSLSISDWIVRWQMSFTALLTQPVAQLNVEFVWYKYFIRIGCYFYGMLCKTRFWRWTFWLNFNNCKNEDDLILRRNPLVE